MANAIDTEASDYLLEIRSGLYRGVTHELASGRHLVGSGDDADLMLMEPDLAPLHAGIVLQADTIRVEGFAEGISIEGVGPVPAGAARTVRLPATIAIAGIETVWHERESEAVEAAPAPAGRFAELRALLGRPAIPGLAAAGILAVTIILTVANPIAGAAVLFDGSAKTALQRIGADPSKAAQQAASPAPAQAQVPSAQSIPTQSAPAQAVPAQAAAPAPAHPAPAHVQQAAVQIPAPKHAGPAHAASKGSVEAAATALSRQVRAAGLLNVHVSAGGGAVSATGTIEPAMASRWEGLQKDFDERFVGEITLVNSVAVKAEKLPASLGIEGVWRGAQPYIVIRGQRYLVGAVVDGGWAIRGIEADRVMLEREGRLVAMRF